MLHQHTPFFLKTNSSKDTTYAPIPTPTRFAPLKYQFASQLTYQLQLAFRRKTKGHIPCPTQFAFLISLPMALP